VIVMKFGGSSVADAERIRAVAEIVAERRSATPVVVLSALEGVTDLLENCLETACNGLPEDLEPLWSRLERSHRWALAGAIEDAGRRHDLRLEVDGLFDDLRGKLRSIRILGEETPRARDAVLAFGETLSTRIASAAFEDCGLPAVWVDSREWMRTDSRFGAAEPDLGAVRGLASTSLRPILEAGKIPVVAGFVGANAAGETTTLGRGGSDTSAVVLGLALDARAIEIWTDVDGLMSADPRLVPQARTLERVTFAEAAELAFYGARVLHPASIAPAARQRVPVRVLNSLRPAGEGTLILDGDRAGQGARIAVTSRCDVRLATLTSKSMRVDSALLSRLFDRCSRLAVSPELLLSSGTGLSWVAPDDAPLERLQGELGPELRLELREDRAICGVVGGGLSDGGPLLGRVLQVLAGAGPDLILLGASGASVLAVLEEQRLSSLVDRLHRQFFEGGEVE
jgi:aspartate kinase